MKQHIIIFFVFFILFLSNINAYELHFSNFTDKFLIIVSKKRAGIVERFYQIVGPGNSVIQPWSDANCLESLQWAELDQKLPLRGGLDLRDPKRGNQIPPEKQKTFDETFFSKTTGKGLYLWNNLKIVMVPNELFQKTVKNAATLVKGFDKMVCQSIFIQLLELKDKAFALLNQGLTDLEKQLQEAIQKKAAEIDADKVAILNNLISSLQTKITETREKVENYIKTKINEKMNKQECFFNLSQIAEAAGKIHGISLCKSRQFVIFDTGTTDSLTGMPLYLAETTEGE